eukprot:scaffold109164_cov45-Phaeocystis_antarctica.AAC.1
MTFRLSSPNLTCVGRAFPRSSRRIHSEDTLLEPHGVYSRPPYRRATQLASLEDVRDSRPRDREQGTGRRPDQVAGRRPARREEPPQTLHAVLQVGVCCGVPADVRGVGRWRRRRDPFRAPTPARHGVYG